LLLPRPTTQLPTVRYIPLPHPFTMPSFRTLPPSQNSSLVRLSNGVDKSSFHASPLIPSIVRAAGYCPITATPAVPCCCGIPNHGLNPPCLLFVLNVSLVKRLHFFSFHSGPQSLSFSPPYELRLEIEPSSVVFWASRVINSSVISGVCERFFFPLRYIGAL